MNKKAVGVRPGGGRVLRLFDPWRGPLCTCPVKYSLHPYTGCSHRCLYCYATSYIGERDSVPKKSFIESLKRDLQKADSKLIVELSTSSDPYPPLEEKVRLTRETLALLLNHGMKVLITSKSDLVIRDIDLLRRMNVAVMLTLTTLDSSTSKILEPNAPSPQARLNALRGLSTAGIPVGVRVDPIVPEINDDPHELSLLVERAYECGASHVVTSTYKARLDNFRRVIEGFPEARERLVALYFDRKNFVRGYYYLPKNIRIRLLKPVTETAKRLWLSYATCREGLSSKDFFSARSCDGSHLIKLS